MQAVEARQEEPGAPLPDSPACRPAALRGARKCGERGRAAGVGERGGGRLPVGWRGSGSRGCPVGAATAACRARVSSAGGGGGPGRSEPGVRDAVLLLYNFRSVQRPAALRAGAVAGLPGEKAGAASERAGWGSLMAPPPSGFLLCSSLLFPSVPGLSSYERALLAVRDESRI